MFATNRRPGSNETGGFDACISDGMVRELGPRRVVAPDGVEWRVGRRWLTRRPRFRRPRLGEPAAESLTHFGPDLASVDFEEGLLVVAAIVAFILVLVPLLFFGIELIVLGALLAGGVIARTVLRQPWVIEARSTDPRTSARQLEWTVRGWRNSGKLIDQVASDLSAGREPDERALPRA
jgi:hypothetical protein